MNERRIEVAHGEVRSWIFPASTLLFTEERELINTKKI